MDSRTAKINQYMLDSNFLDDSTVVHSTNLVAGVRVAVPPTSWKREEKLGAGGFGTVWREVEQGTGQVRAVKVISKLQLNVREVEALIDLQDYPSLFIGFLGWFEDPHATYIAMEYIEHGDLAQYIDQHHSQAVAEVKEITKQILNGLVVMHSRGICHRDLKPQNILVKSISPILVKITDFGISKQSLETSLRTACGTSCYQAPEVLGLLPWSMRTDGSNSYTNAVDLWALGAVVHKILTTEIPFLDEGPGGSSALISGIDVGSATEQYAEIDMSLLSDYCRGERPFPVGSLRKNLVARDGIGFVYSLMVADPRERVSAERALNSVWLGGTENSR